MTKHNGHTKCQVAEQEQMKTHQGVTEAFGRTPLTKKRSHNPNPDEEQIRTMTNLGITLVSLLSLSLLLGIVTATTANPVSIPDNGTLLGVSYNPAISEQDLEDLQSFENWCDKKHSVVVILFRTRIYTDLHGFNFFCVNQH